jgi:hypothetical protein
MNRDVSSSSRLPRLSCPRDMYGISAVQAGDLVKGEAVAAVAALEGRRGHAEV